MSTPPSADAGAGPWRKSTSAILMPEMNSSEMWSTARCDIFSANGDTMFTEYVDRPGRKTTPWLTYSIISVQFAVFIALVSAQGSSAPWKDNVLNVLYGPPNSYLKKFGAVNSNAHLSIYVRVLTSLWINAGLLQLIVTCVCLFKIGSDVEQHYGRIVFLSLYSLSGLGASLTSITFSYPSQLGDCASGPLFGLFGSDLAFFIHNYHELGPGRWRSLSGFVVCSTVLLIIGLHPSINNFAHIGGFVIGITSSMALLSRFHTLSGHSWLRYNKRSLAICIIFTMITLGLLISMAVSNSRAPSRCVWCHYFDCIPNRWWDCPTQ